MKGEMNNYFCSQLAICLFAGQEEPRSNPEDGLQEHPIQ